MEIHYSRIFLNHLKKRIPPDSALEEKFKTRLALFLKDRTIPILKDHKLKGKLQSFRAFSITGDVRIVYFEKSKDVATFIDIGTHNQVYS